ncbi:uncharacterized protein AKAW2_10875S [Aspergillus luchuensis]|uniref:Uncharacterized protein n=1 Tax=Aspergillus kawachii TaxID=1069201 RepID=A0A7R7ZUI9_ASPKA|nr:uncharacterized protein AKAW2_10875S [Aspergillus luchuensis]BCR93829.1 hypothetical protein AKAW2_10875S [Aspergillus luchuensis]
MHTDSSPLQQILFMNQGNTDIALRDIPLSVSFVEDKAQTRPYLDIAQRSRDTRLRVSLVALAYNHCESHCSEYEASMKWSPAENPATSITMIILRSSRP